MDKEISAALRAVRLGKACLIDVRTEKEWQAGHAKAAEHFELGRLENAELPKVDKSQPVYVYCVSGNRPGRA